MRVCLINPPSAFLMDDRVFMPLGLLRVAAVLEEKGHEVQFLDLAGRKDCAKVLEATKADIYGITATTPQMPAAVKIANGLREAGRRTIIGGPHATLVHAARATTRGAASLWDLLGLFDVVVAGDGEGAVLEALDGRGLINADDPKSPLFQTNADLEALPWAARHLVDVESYHYQIDGVRALSLIAQLGCPFGCGFCGGRRSAFLRRIRTRSTQNVLDEIAYVHQVYSCRGFMFMDDELNVNPGMVGLMNGIHDLGLDLRLRGFIKAELFTDQQAEAMHWAGFREILVGFESGHERILKNIEKKATRADNTRCVAIAKAHGLRVKALLSLGHPGESRETVEATKEWLLETRPDDFDATIITPYPGTPYFDDARQEQPGYWTYTAKSGDKLHAESVDYLRVADYYKGIPGDYVSHVFTDHLSPEELVGLRDDLEAEGRRVLGCPPPKRYEHSMGAGWQA
jgi:radical SAM superfamily enzyme YgiQ (UPF0313 family)